MFFTSWRIFSAGLSHHVVHFSHPVWPKAKSALYHTHLPSTPNGPDFGRRSPFALREDLLYPDRLLNPGESDSHQRPIGKGVPKEKSEGNYEGAWYRRRLGVNGETGSKKNSQETARPGSNGFRPRSPGRGAQSVPLHSSIPGRPLGNSRLLPSPTLDTNGYSPLLQSTVFGYHPLQ